MGRREGVRVLGVAKSERSARSARSPPLPVCRRSMLPLSDARRASATRRQTKSRGLAHHLRTGNLSVVAAAGRDLFRKGLLLDGVASERQAARHPAVRPNLRSIPEDESDDELVSSFGELVESQAVVVMGDDGESWSLVERRVQKAVELFWDAQHAFAEQQAGACCYLIPMSSDAAVEAEQMRSALMKAGVSPHLVIMDCCPTSIVDGAVQLTQTLRRLHIQKVHVVSSEFHLPRVRLVVRRVLSAAAVDDVMHFSVSYQSAPDDLSPIDRSRRTKSEQQLIETTEEAIRDAVDALETQQSRSLVITKRTRISIHTRETNQTC